MARFHLFNAMHGETVAKIEMDEELLREEAGIVDMETLTLRPIKNGGNYTLMPMEDHTLAILKSVEDSYNHLTKEPAAHISGYISRSDGLITAVGLLFKKMKYIIVEGPEDLDKLINPPKGEYEPKVKEYDVLGDLLALLDSSRTEVVEED